MLYAVILLIFGIGLVILEILLPSGGVISILAGGALIGSLVFAFMEGSGVGLIFLVVQLICIPVFIIIGFKLLPRTRLGRMFILNPQVEDTTKRGSAGVSTFDLSGLKGKVGVTVTPLRPSGIVEINDERYSAVSEGDMIDKDVEIVVSQIEGNSIVVESRNR